MAAPTPSTSSAATRVVIAEDEALIRLDLREMLREEGFDVVGEAADGEEAVALAEQLAPDLVICDIKMPKMDGIAAAAAITGRRIAPVVMLTAFSQRDLIERARDAGAMAYLVKPFEKRDLLPAIAMAMSRFAEIRALEAEVSGLQDRLEVRKLVERAKGRLMTAHALTEPEAFRWIQRAAMDTRTTMRAVAELVLADVTPGDGPATPGAVAPARLPTGAPTALPTGATAGERAADEPEAPALPAAQPTRTADGAAHAGVPGPVEPAG